MESQSPDKGTFDAESAIRAYQGLITELPPLNRQLLLYILDLLAVFASKSDLNKMTTPNLAAIFQPGLLSHPQHDMAPQEYRLSQDVLIFLIENQDSFLVGMPGTAADEKTVKEVQSGAPTPVPSSPSTPNKAKPLGRSNSNASAGADSIQKWGSIRRNASVSSKRSRGSVGGPGSQSPSLITPVPTNSGVYRSNTLPSKRSISGASPRFPRDQSHPSTPSPSNSFQGALPATIELPTNDSLQTTPTASQQPVQKLINLPTAPEVISAASSEATTPLAVPGTETPTASLLPKVNTVQSDVNAALAPPNVVRDGSSERSVSGSRNLLEIFKQSPGGSDGERKDSKQPRKLQKKRLPGSALSSAQSSAADLQSGDEYGADSPITPTFQRGLAASLGETGFESQYTTARSTPRSRTPQRQDTDTTIRAAASSPQRSYRSASATDMSESDFTDDGNAVVEQQKEKRRWRFSQAAKPRTGSVNLRSVAGNDPSRSTLASSSGAGSKSIQNSQELSPRSTHTGTSPPEPILSDSEEKKKGPMSWIRGKIAEHKEREAEKRGKSPMKGDRNALTSESRQSLHRRKESVSSRGKSLEVPRASMSQARNVPAAAATTTAANTALHTPSAPTVTSNTAIHTPSAPPTTAAANTVVDTPSATPTAPMATQASPAAQSALPATIEPVASPMPPPVLQTPPMPVQSAPVTTQPLQRPQEPELEKTTTAVPISSTAASAAQHSENEGPTPFTDITTTIDAPTPAKTDEAPSEA